MNDIRLRKITEKEFLLAQKAMLQDPNSYQFVRFNSYDNCRGIEYEGKIIGFYHLKRYIKGNISIELAIIPEYRGKRLASRINDLIVKIHGKDCPGSEYFLTTIDLRNTKALKSIEGTDWQRLYIFDEIMYAEGGEEFQIYGKKNPQYNKDINPYSVEMKI